MQTTNYRRRAQLAIIHRYKRDQGLCNDAYRNILYSVAGERSSALMSEAQRQAVINFFASQVQPAPLPEVTDEEALAIIGAI